MSQYPPVTNSSLEQNETVHLNQISFDIGCLATANMRATLISTRGYHCDVWEASRVEFANGERRITDYIIKRHKQPCPMNEVRILARDYRELKRHLGEMVPNAVFVPTLVDGIESLVVIAKPVRAWFNLANPINEEETVPLLRKRADAARHLEIFTQKARAWYQSPDMKVIDLWGVDNLVMDTKLHVRYVDSFRVFFYADLMHVIDNVDEMLKERIDMSLLRLEYLEYVVREAKTVRVA